MSSANANCAAWSIIIYSVVYVNSAVNSVSTMSRMKAVDEYEHLKYCAARYVWLRSKQKTPASIKELKKEYPLYSRVVTWEKWWERKFNDNYKQYIARIKKTA